LVLASLAERRGTIMINLVNEEYLRGILDNVEGKSESLSRDDFYALCRLDICSGYRVEVDEAARRYFAKKKRPVASMSVV
jgi:hypothetical protein